MFGFLHRLATVAFVSIAFVSASPAAGDKDEECAKAGLKAIRDRIDF
jgi:hypothetical protein